MGTYDNLNLPGCRADGAQVKLWGCKLKTLSIGDRVPDVEEVSTYGVVLREGGVLLIKDNVIEGWGEEVCRHDRPLFDKWGDPWTVFNVGIMTEPYFWE